MIHSFHSSSPSSSSSALFLFYTQKSHRKKRKIPRPDVLNNCFPPISCVAKNALTNRRKRTQKSEKKIKIEIRPHLLARAYGERNGPLFNQHFPNSNHHRNDKNSRPQREFECMCTVGVKSLLIKKQKLFSFNFYLERLPVCRCRGYLERQGAGAGCWPPAESWVRVHVGNRKEKEESET
jgi:hypothetical protein